MLADDVRIDARGAHAESLGQVHAKTQTIEVGAGAEHSLVTCKMARNIG